MIEVGSKVVLVDDRWMEHPIRHLCERPIVNVVYTVRDIRFDDEFYILLNEIINPVLSWYDDDRDVLCYGELGFSIYRFREVELHYSSNELSSELLNLH